MRVEYRGQPTADTGGVTRQFFTQLLDAICDSFFQGTTYKLPIYNPEMVASRLMKYVETIIVHRIIQGGPDFPVFSPAIYQYLCTGNTDAAMTEMTIICDCSEPIKDFILSVARAKDVKTELDQEQCINILSECGITIPLNNDNKMVIIQSIIIHNAIGKPKIVLDQLHEGLATLGFQEQMSKSPSLFEELFVSGKAALSSDILLSILAFPKQLNVKEENIKVYLEQFFLGANNKDLQYFLKFCTGAICLPNFGLGRIHVQFSDTDSIFFINMFTYTQLTMFI